MKNAQRLPPSLTPLDLALELMLRELKPVAANGRPPLDTSPCEADDMPELRRWPPHDVAAVDGWALRAVGLVGASSYTPLPLTRQPPWVEAGERIPDGCDCVLDDDSVDRSMAMAQALGEAIPGQGIRRKGGEIADAKPDRRCLAARRSSPGDLSKRCTGRGCAWSMFPAAHHGEADCEKPVQRRHRIRFGRCGCARCGVDRPTRSAPMIAICCSWSAAAASGERMRRSMALAGRGEVHRAWACAAARAHRRDRQDRQHARHRVARRARSGARRLVDARAAGARSAERAARTARRSTCRWRARSPPLSESRKSCCSNEARGDLDAARGRRSRRWKPIARADAWLLVPGSSEGYAAGTPVDAYMLRE